MVLVCVDGLAKSLWVSWGADQEMPGQTGVMAVAFQCDRYNEISGHKECSYRTTKYNDHRACDPKLLSCAETCCDETQFDDNDGDQVRS
jgi:hypothetical protein